MLCNNGGGIFERESVEVARTIGAGRGSGRSIGAGGNMVLALVPSKRAAMALVVLEEVTFNGRTVFWDSWENEGTCRVGDPGALGVVVVPRVFSHGGGCADALLVVECRSGVCWDGVEGVCLGGELFGVDGFTVVEGECVRGELARRKGEVRGLLKESGEGL